MKARRVRQLLSIIPKQATENPLHTFIAPVWILDIEADFDGLKENVWSWFNAFKWNYWKPEVVPLIQIEYKGTIMCNYMHKDKLHRHLQN